MGVFCDKWTLLSVLFSTEGKVYALKQIEGTGISMTACREIAVSLKIAQYKVPDWCNDLVKEFSLSGQGNYQKKKNCLSGHGNNKNYEKIVYQGTEMIESFKK